MKKPNIELFYYQDQWECFCLNCPWDTAMSNNPKFHSARKHYRETGHEVIISRVSKWSYGALPPSKLKG